MLTASEIIRLLNLTPHPEGGHFRETFRDSQRTDDGSALSTAIYFLLAEGERSLWHRIDAVETWHFYAGSPLELSIFDGADETRVILGPDIARGEHPQATVMRGVWQAARSLGSWTLAGCTVAPGFDFEKFELAPPGWSPSRRTL